MAIEPKLWLHEQERGMDRDSNSLGVLRRLLDHDTSEGYCIGYG